MSLSVKKKFTLKKVLALMVLGLLSYSSDILSVNKNTDKEPLDVYENKEQMDAEERYLDEEVVSDIEKEKKHPLTIFKKGDIEAVLGGKVKLTYYEYDHMDSLNGNVPDQYGAFKHFFPYLKAAVERAI